MPKYTLRNILISARKYTNIPKNPAYSTSKVMAIGSVLLFTSAFLLIRNHPLMALILGIISITMLISGGAKSDNSAAPFSNNLCRHCGSKYESDWTYCAQCSKLLSHHTDNPHARRYAIFRKTLLFLIAFLLAAFIHITVLADLLYPDEHTVFVTGSVNFPGFYHASTETRVYELVDAAGGFAPGADYSGINLAEKVRGKRWVMVPGR